MRRVAVRLAAAVRVRMRFVRMSVGVGVAVVRVFVRMRLMLVRLRVSVRVGGGFMFVPGSGRVGRNNVDFCAGETAADDLAHLKVRAHVQGVGGLCQGVERDARIDQRAEQHIAAYAGKTLKVTNTHRVVILNG